MSSFAICLNAVAPLFLMMATGYAAKRAGIIHESDVARINMISFKIFMPMMCFYNVYDGEFLLASDGSASPLCASVSYQLNE